MSLPILAWAAFTLSCNPATVDTPETVNQTQTKPPAANSTPQVQPDNQSDNLVLTQSVLDFDSGIPPFPPGKPTPFEQISGNITAYFSSPSDPAAFSIQSQQRTFLPLTEFVGNYLHQNSISATKLSISFSQPLNAIKLSFATMDSHSVGEVDIPTTLKLTAYLNSDAYPVIGSATATGSFAYSSLPQGVITFESVGSPFNLIILELVRRPDGTTVFHIDSIAASIAVSDD